MPLAGLALAMAVLPLGSLRADSDTRFDGAWETILSCENAGRALGYSYKFQSSVKNGTLHGERGVKGKPGWLQLDGVILTDGSADLYAQGLVGAAETAVGRRPAGTDYGYHVDAKFSGDAGAGKRVEGRACSVTFTRKK